MKTAGLSRNDWLAATVLCVAAVVVFGAGADGLGFYADDSACLTPAGSDRSLWSDMTGYMPGRNLHPLWHHLLAAIIGDPAEHLAAAHLAQSAVDGATAAVFFFLLRLLGLPGYAAVTAAGWFAFWPVHGESHFWLESLPNNISTLFVILFALTSLALAGGERRWWLWMADAAAFVSALFTYDQAFVVLLVLLAARVAAVRRRGFAAVHVPHLAAGAFCAWLRLASGSGPMPPGPAGLLPAILANVQRTVRTAFGEAALVEVAPLYGKVTPGDWVLALAAAASITAVSVWLLLGSTRSVGFWPAGRTLALSVLFTVAAYLPSWLWSISPRHHYLPSVGIFAAAAAAVAWVLERFRGQAVRVSLAVSLGVVSVPMAAAGRGESRFWEQAFAAKKQMFAELKPELAGKEILVLEDFPYFLGPALLISLHDAKFGPQLFDRGRPALLHGAISRVSAPGGLFLYTHHFEGAESFRYFADPRSLVVRFLAWENGRLKYEKNPASPLPYVLIPDRSIASNESRFAVHKVSATEAGDSLTVSLDFTAHLPPQTYVAATFGYVHGDGFYRWGRLDREGHSVFYPVLLSDPGRKPRPGGLRFEQTLRLHSFPRTGRIQVEFYQASPSSDPVLLGRAEAAVEP